MAAQIGHDVARVDFLGPGLACGLGRRGNAARWSRLIARTLYHPLTRFTLGLLPFAYPLCAAVLAAS
jgi:hypothetical protein